ncbi:hypothetical protein [Thiorhodovibrio winogradskyi]|uniref:hypothetical protein n=1 Tax=Thiorhodovibrio winogradskyi TaxID=77007 RepID=UPI002E2B712E|nr:hypothetical protein [Thiorhodovibrio winogradskyi]
MLAWVLAFILLSGCETTPDTEIGLGGVDGTLPPSIPGLRSLQDGGAAQEAATQPSGGGFLAGFMGGASCPEGESNDCAEQEATQADDCLRQAIELPHPTSDRDARMRRLLDCAERHYKQALQESDSKQGSNRRVAYHGGLLLTLSERRNRLDDNAREPRVGRENDKLLKAADAARAEAPESALGFLYGASARLFRATLLDDDSSRCEDLREASAMLSASPTPPEALEREQKRLIELADSELERCALLKQAAARGSDAELTSADVDVIIQSDAIQSD